MRLQQKKENQIITEHVCREKKNNTSIQRDKDLFTLRKYILITLPTVGITFCALCLVDFIRKLFIHRKRMKYKDDVG